MFQKEMSPVMCHRKWKCGKIAVFYHRKFNIIYGKEAEAVL